MKNEELMKQTAAIIDGELKGRGMNVSTDFIVYKIEDKLRYSWYVSKLLEKGHTHYIHINIHTDDFACFLAVLDDGSIMSGSNCMIQDFFNNYCWSVLGREEFYLDDYEGISGECDDDDEENGIVYWNNIESFIKFTSNAKD